MALVQPHVFPDRSPNQSHARWACFPLAHSAIPDMAPSPKPKPKDRPEMVARRLASDPSFRARCRQGLREATAGGGRVLDRVKRLNDFLATVGAGRLRVPIVTWLGQVAPPPAGSCVGWCSRRLKKHAHQLTARDSRCPLVHLRACLPGVGPGGG